jgi:PmbA protein
MTKQRRRQELKDVATEQTTKESTDLRTIATDVVQRAISSGATAAEAVVREGNEFSTMVRLGQVETLKEAGARALGLRVFIGQRAANTYTSDFSREGIEHLVSGAVQLARVTSEDPFGGLPEASQFGSIKQDLDLYYEDVYSLPAAERIDYARRAEKAAMDYDSRIQNSDGAGFDAATGRKVLANSLGFVGDYQRSFCSMVAIPIAIDESGMQRDGWDSASRTITKLESPESVGREAARRTIRRLGARKIATTKVPVIFDPQTAQSIVEYFFEGANGDAIYRGASFFEGKLGERIAGENITVIDDGTMVGGFGSSPFDSEGVPTRRTVVVERGVLKSYLLNTYTARKLNMQTTGNAYRGLAGTPGIGTGNFFLQPGTQSPDQMIKDVKQGLYVTGFLGSSVSLVTGDFSRGVNGIWIENGELAYPVEEITIAGNLKDMFKNINAIGNDLEFRSALASPTIRIDGLTIAGA